MKHIQPCFTSFTNQLCIMKTIHFVLVCIVALGNANAQFTLSNDLSQSYASESAYQLIFTDNNQHYEATIPQPFNHLDSIAVVYHDTLTIDDQLSMRMKVHLVNSKTHQYIWQQIAIPLELNPISRNETQKYVQIAAFKHEDWARNYAKKAFLFKPQVIQVKELWKVVIPYTVGLYDEVKKYHQDAFIALY